MIKSFLFTGIICAIAQFIKDKTTLTNGHITTLLVVIGSVLSFFGLYDLLIEYFGGGASVVILSFGNTLYKTAIQKGILRMLEGVSIGIVSSILFSFLVVIFFKNKS